MASSASARRPRSGSPPAPARRPRTARRSRSERPVLIAAPPSRRLVASVVDLVPAGRVPARAGVRRFPVGRVGPDDRRRAQSADGSDRAGTRKSTTTVEVTSPPRSATANGCSISSPAPPPMTAAGRKRGRGDEDGDEHRRRLLPRRGPQRLGGVGPVTGPVPDLRPPDQHQRLAHRQGHDREDRGQHAGRREPRRRGSRPASAPAAAERGGDEQRRGAAPAARRRLQQQEDQDGRRDAASRICDRASGGSAASPSTSARYSSGNVILPQPRSSRPRPPRRRRGRAPPR